MICAEPSGCSSIHHSSSLRNSELLPLALRLQNKLTIHINIDFLQRLTIY